MILNEIELHNFGVYRGRHQLELTPPSAAQPVVLFGGLNGGGKTTLLDALQLSLYGKRARCSTRGDLAYGDFLRNSTHRKVDPAEGAGVALHFTHVVEGAAHRYEIRRTWSTTASGTREHVEVLCDDEVDQVLTDTWDDQVDTFMPQELAQLFFFDGEKIKALAEPSHSAEILRSGMQSLLGVDLVDRLSADLVTVARRARSSLGSDEDRAELERAAANVAEAEAQRAELVQQRAAAQNDVDRRRRDVTKCGDRLRAEGGELFESRAALEAQRELVSQELSYAEDELRQLAAGELPLASVTTILRRARDQADRESAAAGTADLVALLADRDARLLERIAQHEGLADCIPGIREWLTADRRERQSGDEAAPYLVLTGPTSNSLNELIGSRVSVTVETGKRLVSRAETLQDRLVQLDRKLAMAPERDAIAELLEARLAARAELAAAESRLAQLDEILRQATVRAEGARATHAKLLSTRVSAEFDREDTQRTLRATSRVGSALDLFKVAVVRRHVARIEGLVLESFQKLMRKRTLVTEIRIDPGTFQLDLRDRDGEPVPANRLSAGERQILAVAILWGLARASGRGLPAVIDTPLGRLDSVHRRHLVERYFPKASHQVLLLSTDEEIDEAQLGRLRRHVGRYYRLDYDEKRDATTVSSEYFW